VVYTTSSTVVVLFVLAVLVILVLVQNVLQKQERPLERERRSVEEKILIVNKFSPIARPPDVHVHNVLPVPL
jgi:hypothetical protein